MICPTLQEGGVMAWMVLPAIDWLNRPDNELSELISHPIISEHDVCGVPQKYGATVKIHGREILHFYLSIIFEILFIEEFLLLLKKNILPQQWSSELRPINGTGLA